MTDHARISLYSTGVLRSALRSAAAAFTDASGIAVDQTYGNSGKLRERILSGGETPDIYTAGDVDNPEMLRASGRYGEVTVVAHAQMALLLKTTVPAERSVADIMLDPAVRLVTGVLTPPKIDPAGGPAVTPFCTAKRCSRRAATRRCRPISRCKRRSD